MTICLAITDLHHRYGRHDVLLGVDLELHAGELVGLVGPNGAGKSTLLHCIAAGEPLQRGRILIDGLDITQAPMETRARLGISVEPERLPPLLTTRQCLQLVSDLRNAADTMPTTLDFCEAVGLTAWLDRRGHELSLGTRQKLAIALALIGTPSLIVLDEVLNGLDPLAAYALKEALRKRADAGACIVLATHGLEVAERFLDRAVLLLDGRIAADWDAEALRQFRADPDGGLEHAVVARLRAAKPATPAGVPVISQ